MELFLDPESGRSLAGQIYDQLWSAIVDDRIPAGSRLPATRAVAEELDVARSTVTEAYARLTAEGLVEGRRGGGSIVVGAVSHRRTVEPEPVALSPTPTAAALARSPFQAEHARFDLTPGRADPNLFPAATWRRCVARALSTTPMARYGDPAGSLELRLALSHWVRQSRGVESNADQIVVTHGAAHAIDLLAGVLLRPGDMAAVEEPGYWPVTSLLRTQGVEVVGVPVDAQGMVVDAIPDRTRLVHVTPSHQFPLGTVLSRNRRLELLRWAARHNAAIVEDDYDSEFRHTPRPLEPLSRMDRDGRVLYVGTFSKTLSPALRLGFAVAPLALVPALTAVRQSIDWGPPVLTAAAMTAFIVEGHLGRHVRRAGKLYRTRHRVVWRALSQIGADRLTPMPTEAGLHIAALTPAEASDIALVERARAQDVLVSSLSRTYQFDDPQSGVVIGFGAVATEDVPEAVGRLRNCLE